jgi:leucyl-tRNA synthetase
VKKEIEAFGNPPKFPEVEQDGAGSAAKHSKVAAKTGNAKYQCQIMESIGIPLNEVSKFADPNHWLEFFPPLAKQDLIELGLHVDWRRSFVTTDVNPFYDSFIRWQFNKLRTLDKIKFGKRHTIFSPLDNQPCMDHDRQSGEGVDPKEYTAIKLELVDFLPGFEGKKTFLLAATLRPETMYGQTNCWVGPEIEYGIYRVGSDTLYVCTERAARNLSYQDEFGDIQGKYERVGTIKGLDLIGKAVIAPLSFYKHVYVLPMLSISASKGTGIVTSVPSNSPDDFAALRDLVEKEPFRKKYGLKDEMVLPFQPVAIIETPGLGAMSAAFLVNDLKIKSQNDKDNLEKAKAIAYKEDFYVGKMTFGPHSGKPVSEVKPVIREELISEKQAISYYEPENLVMSRSGDECVVALTDQWYLDYGQDDWKALAENCVSKMEFYAPEIKNQFEATLAWMRQWACSRSFGLGTKIPWDPKYLIESLSDSTIYMAYYTISHILHEGSNDGSVSPNGIKPEQMTHEVWEYIFGEDFIPLPINSGISQDLLERMRKEFRFFYPLDLRVSGKDLVPNHLTMSIYNHVALFPERFWPRSFRANGHLLLNSEKMSKSTGNFMTIRDAIEDFGADATRLALADAGDSIEDANFLKDTANAAILRLYNLFEFAKEAIQGDHRVGELNYQDKVFDATLSRAVVLTEQAYKSMLYRDVVKHAFFELQNARDFYRDATIVHGSQGMHKDVLRRFVELQVLLMSPIIPHFAEHVWTEILGNKSSILLARFPAQLPYDEALVISAEYLRSVAHGMRASIQAEATRKGKGKGPETPKETPDSVELYVAKTFPGWQEEVIEVLRANYDAVSKSMKVADDQIVALTKPIMKTITDKSALKIFIPFVMELKVKLLAEGPKVFNRALPFDEAAILAQNLEFITKSLGLVNLSIKTDPNSSDAEAKKKFEAALPGSPAIRLFKA